MNLKYDAEELPFSVKPEKKVSLQDLMAFYRTTYTGSEYDMTKNLKVEQMRSRRTQEKKEKKDQVIADINWVIKDDTGAYIAMYGPEPKKPDDYQFIFGIKIKSRLVEKDD